MNNLSDTFAAPEYIPERGFYYHFKHDPTGPFNVMAYEVLGVQFHTEEESLLVSYRPLYREAFAFEKGLLGGYARPLDMFLGNVEKTEYHGPRFIEIVDPDIIEKLRAVRDEMYPQV